jgi:hypothetical protein
MKMDDRQNMEDQIRRLTREAEEMRARIARLEGRDAANGHEPSRSSRRNFLRLGAGAAIGALGMAAAKVIPAAAADGATVVTGSTVTGEHPTIIQGDAATAVPVFAAQAQGSTPPGAGVFAGPLQGLGTTTGAIEGVDGWAQGAQAFSVYGLTDAGTGVVGESSTGIGLYARASGRVRQDPHALVSGVPDYTPNDFEQVRDANGNLWISQAGGVWRKVAIFQSFPNPRRILDGFATPFTSGNTYGPLNATLETDGVTPTGIPVGATSAFCAVQSYSAGALTLFPDGTTDPAIANYSATTSGPLNLTYMFVPLSAAGKFKIHAYITGRCFVDAWGFVF